jgi:phosphatidylserine decarboxylase
LKIVKEGHPFIISLSIVCLFCFILSRYTIIFFLLGVLLFILTCFFLYFFRDPKIKITYGDPYIIAPCNGTVIEVDRNETGKFIRVFLSIFDIHLQRSPISGIVTNIEYRPGNFLHAMNGKAHLQNEQNIITVENASGRYIIKQIAGMIARRCITWVKQGDYLNQGDKLGVIKFGSQVDLYMPNHVDVIVRKGNKVISGVTIVAIKNV